MGVSFHFVIAVLLLLAFFPSQIFWLRRVAELGRKVIRDERWRAWLGGAGVILYLSLFAYNLGWAARRPSPVHLTLQAALLQAPFLWWILSSIAGFIIVLPFWLAYRAFQGGGNEAGVAHEAVSPGNVAPHVNAEVPARDAVSPGRRSFLYKAAVLAGAASFAADAYGIVIGRSELVITRHKIRLERLPKAFEGFRIAQVSDLHIGPFTTARRIREVAEITNRLKADLIALTGDFVTWDPTNQGAVVEALAVLRAPYGVYGCLGNHELWSHCQDSITRIFARQNVRILRQERAEIRSRGETLNLLGVDFETRGGMAFRGGYVRQYLESIEPLVRPDTVNILMSHNPNTFDRAAALGIDLSFAGHTHGGQVTLNFISPDLSPARLITPYVRGWFQKPGGQLYVNCGIGTIFAPIRFDAPPEISVFELVRS